MFNDTVYNIIQNGFPKEPFIVTPAEIIHILDIISNGSQNLVSDPGCKYEKSGPFF